MNNIETLRTALAGGVAPAMATPLVADGRTVNTEVVPQLVDFLIKRGVKGLFVGGTTGEGVLLDLNERRRLHAATISAAANRIPVLVHVGTNNTPDTLTLIAHARELGADAIVAVTPYFFGIPENALYSYFAQLCEASGDIPFLAYDIPQMAVNGVSPALLKRLCQLPNFAGVKCSRPDMQVIRQHLDVLPEGRFLLAGNEQIALGSLALGSIGMISGLATAIPEPFVSMIAAQAAGDYTTALAAQKRINQLLIMMPAGARIGAIKQVLIERGVNVGPTVPPWPMPEEPIWPHLEAIALA